MNSTCRTAIAAAVAGGYVLGRTRKAKMAFAIGTFLAGRRFGLSPTALAAEGLRQLRESPQLADLREQMGGELLDAVRAAANTSADRRFAAFADTLRERGRARDDEQEPPDEADEAHEDADVDVYEGEDGVREEPAEGHADRRGRPHERRKPAKKSAAKKSAAKKADPARKKSGPAKKAAAKKTASSRSRSASSRSGR
jgi:hypothetical protein